MIKADIFDSFPISRKLCSVITLEKILSVLYYHWEKYATSANWKTTVFKKVFPLGWNAMVTSGQRRKAAHFMTAREQREKGGAGSRNSPSGAPAPLRGSHCLPVYLPTNSPTDEFTGKYVAMMVPSTSERPASENIRFSEDTYILSNFFHEIKYQFYFIFCLLFYLVYLLCFTF